MDKIHIIKNWIVNHKRFVIIGSVLIVLLIVVAFGLTFNFFRIQGSVYDVDSIGENIDKIKVGDTINYTANGYGDWKVHSINKEDNKIEIISKSSVENLTIKSDEFDTYLDILQSTANKYLDGKYAVSARSVGEDDLEKLNIEDGYWISKKDNNNLYLSSKYVPRNCLTGQILPVVEININDVTNYEIGDIFDYSLNGINEWIIFELNGSTSVSIIPKKPIDLNYCQSSLNEFNSYVQSIIEKFKSENVISVRSVDSDDVSSLLSVKHQFGKECNYAVYTGDVVYQRPYDFSDYGGKFFESGNYYNVSLIYISNSYCYFSNNSHSNPVKWTGGFVPVVTLKFDSGERVSKELNSELKVGDYVKYSANGYNNWKVLSIDKKNNTVDVISGGIVKNLTLEGQEDYENLENIFQKEVDKYKTGNNVINARSVEISDFDALKEMKDSLQVNYFLNNKKEYRTGTYYAGLYSYVCAVGKYDVSVSGLKYEWAILADTNLYSSESSPPDRHSYKYTSGLRPIITLKLSEVKKSNSSVNTNDNIYATEQNNDNKTAKETVTDEDLAFVDVVDENEINDNLEKDISEIMFAVNKLENSMNKLEQKYYLLISFVVLLVGVCGFVFVYFGRKFK